jgi:hypothetical protein
LGGGFKQFTEESKVGEEIRKDSYRDILARQAAAKFSPDGAAIIAGSVQSTSDIVMFQKQR